MKDFVPEIEADFFSPREKTPETELYTEIILRAVQDAINPSISSMTWKYANKRHKESAEERGRRYWQDLRNEAFCWLFSDKEEEGTFLNYVTTAFENPDDIIQRVRYYVLKEREQGNYQFNPSQSRAVKVAMHKKRLIYKPRAQRGKYNIRGERGL